MRTPARNAQVEQVNRPDNSYYRPLAEPSRRSRPGGVRRNLESRAIRPITIRIDSYDLEDRRLACGYDLLFQSFQSSRERLSHRSCPPLSCHGRRRPVGSVPCTSIILSGWLGLVRRIVSAGLSLGGPSSASSRSNRRVRFRLGMFVPRMCSGAPSLENLNDG